MTEVIVAGCDVGYIGCPMSPKRRKALVSTALGALIGTVLFHGVFHFLSAADLLVTVTVPTAFETFAIYLFFFAVMWLSNRPLMKLK